MKRKFRLKSYITICMIFIGIFFFGNSIFLNNGSYDLNLDENIENKGRLYFDRDVLNTASKKYSLTYEWNVTIGDIGYDYIYYDIVIDNNTDTIYVAGSIKHDAVSSPEDAYLAKYNKFGEQLWSVTWGVQTEILHIQLLLILLETFI